jgi:hypothetical protein
MTHTAPADATFAWTLDETGLTMAFDGRDLAKASGQWMTLETPDAAHPLSFSADGDDLRAEAAGMAVTLRAEHRPGTAADMLAVHITVANTTNEACQINLKWRVDLAGDDKPRWLLPALLYDENRQQRYTTLPSLTGEYDVNEYRHPYWVFRSDLMAVPMVMGWTPAGAVAMLMPETQAGQMTSLGCDHRPGQHAMIGAWPIREEPRPRGHVWGSPKQLTPNIEFATIPAGQQVELDVYLRASQGEAYDFDPILRETFSWWDDAFPLNPWYPSAESVHHAAHGLFEWHCDKDEPCIWETCAFEPYFGKNEHFVDRFDMHTGFVSGTPSAEPLLRYGLAFDRPDIASKARDVLSFCCENLTRFGTFWSKYSRELGWTTGWPAPQRPPAEDAPPDAPGRDLQCRTLADATLFVARAAMNDTDAPQRDVWIHAVRSNLDFVCSVQREDGNCGQHYDPDTGEVLDWDGEEGIFWIAAFIEGYRLTGEERYLTAAARAGDFYSDAVLRADMTGAPEAMHLLPTSEDPQCGVTSYILLWEETGEQKWLDLARRCAELLMTFRWQYNTEFPPMTICEKYDLKTKGFDVSSPNNVHLHPYGMACIPELLTLWAATGDMYLLKQTRNNFQACHQMLAPVNGAMDAMRGMMTERFAQTPVEPGKGATLSVSHAWCVALVLFVDQAIGQFGHLALDGEAGELIAIEAVDVTGADGEWTVRNPWTTDLDLSIACRKVNGTVHVGETSHTMDGTSLQRVPFTLPAGESLTVRCNT